MKQISSVSDVPRLGTILCLGAHPDDETFMAGGLLALAARNNQTVICVTATKGERGIQDESRWPRERLGSIRQIELQTALELLGVQRHYWLPYLDGQCEKVAAEDAVALLKPILNEHQPDTILTFGPDGLTGHPDHATMPMWAQAAMRELSQKPAIYHAVVARSLYDEHLADLDSKLNMFFNIDKPPLKNDNQCDIALQLPMDICKIKCEALRSMESQTAGLFTLCDDDTICSAWSKETFVAANY